MEELWKDINLATLNEQSRRQTITRSNGEGVMFQDFLAQPLTLSIDPLNTSALSSASSESVSLYFPASPAPPLVTLSLSSRPHLHFDNPQHPTPSHSNLSSVTSLGTKRYAQPDCSLGDRRNKRMIKNRESAARSRARKQAYTSELEVEVKNLKEENARLRRQQRQLSEVAASEHKKGTLYRASTAPF